MSNADVARLRWQCRRGMRELDDLLLRWLEHRHSSANAADKSAFAELLTVSDPELVGYLLKREVPESAACARIIEQILERDSA